MQKAFPLQKSKRGYTLLAQIHNLPKPGHLLQAERAPFFQKQKWGVSPVLSGTCRLSSANSLIFSVSSLLISFTFLLFCKPDLPLGSSIYKLFFFHLPGNIGYVSKVRCEAGLLLSSPPGPSLFLLPKVPWLWISHQLSITTLYGFPNGLAGKESAWNAGDTGDTGSNPGSGRSGLEGNGNPLQYSCLENPMDRGAWCITVQRIAKSWHSWATTHAHKPLVSFLVTIIHQVHQILTPGSCHSLQHNYSIHLVISKSR